MPAVRYLALAALVVWLGGMVILGLIVAPSTFGVLEASDPASGRMLAGAVFGEILRRFHLLAYVCGAILLVCFFVIKFVGPPPDGFLVRAGIAAAMLALALYSGMRISRGIAEIQSQVSGPIGRLPDTDPRRVRFDRLHSMSTMLMTVNVGLGFVLLFWYARE
jgi:hypothetical protein